MVTIQSSLQNRSSLSSPSKQVLSELPRFHFAFLFTDGHRTSAGSKPRGFVKAWIESVNRMMETTNQKIQ